MIRFRTSILAAVLGLAALASGPARADLIVSCTSSTTPSWCTGFGTDQPGNGFLTFNGTAGPYSVTELVSGEDILGLPNVMEVHNFEINVTAPGQLSVFVSETSMTAVGVTKFGLNFGTAQILGDMSGVLRTLWLDYGTVNQQNLGSCSGAASCQSVSAAFNTSGGYSLTEEFDMVAGRGCSGVNACELSTDDRFSLVPEPVSLSLFGSGLLALGALSRRRRKSAKAA